MYNLLVSSTFDNEAGGVIEFEDSRFLEHTSTEISEQLKSLSVEAITCLKSWPAIVMREGRNEELAYLGEIKKIEHIGKKIKVTVSQNKTSILNNQLWKIRELLDIAQFEFNRNHWAVKDLDLFSILNSNDVLTENYSSKFNNLPLPAPQRSELIQAKKFIAQFSHTEIDDLLLEAGVKDLTAEKSIGSPADRANAIITFILKNKNAKTEENRLFSRYIIDKTQTESTSKTFETISNPISYSTENYDIDNKKPINHTSNRVFIVHGRNEVVKISVVAFLLELGLQGIVLHEQPNMGRHLLTKFIDEAELVTFAIVIMTNDDVGALKADDLKLAPRARQNVILELGYFISHLGQSKVCALISPGLETPSDFDGIAYIPMDNEESWKKILKRELIAAGMTIVKDNENYAT